MTLQKRPDEVEIGWGTQCHMGLPAMVVWRALAEVADYGIADAVCDIPATESTTTVPLAQAPGDVWFLVLRYDGEVESSWGPSSFEERNGPTASGECGMPTRAPPINYVCMLAKEGAACPTRARTGGGRTKAKQSHR